MRDDPQLLSFLMHRVKKNVKCLRSNGWREPSWPKQLGYVGVDEAPILTGSCPVIPLNSDRCSAGSIPAPSFD